MPSVELVVPDATCAGTPVAMRVGIPVAMRVGTDAAVVATPAMVVVEPDGVTVAFEDGAVAGCTWPRAASSEIRRVVAADEILDLTICLPARGVEHDRAPPTLEEHLLHLPLERADLQADGGRREPDLLPGAGERPMLDDREERPERADRWHSNTLSQVH